MDEEDAPVTIDADEDGVVDGELYLRLTAHAFVTADAIDRFAEQSIPTIVGWLRG